MEQALFPDHSSADELASIYQKIVADHLAQLDALKEEVIRTRDSAIDELKTASEQRKEIENNAAQIAKEAFDLKYDKLKSELNEKLLTELIIKLIQANRSDDEICKWLNVNIEKVNLAKSEQGFKKFMNGYSRVYYSGEGRGGVIHLQIDQKIINFHWEFGGGNTLALIFIPEEIHWESETGTKLSERMTILEFLASEIISVKAPGHKYLIEDNTLIIL